MKHSKKSLFITTIMMVVLLVAALSTATYAWYTSSNTVSTSETQVNSAESTGANISIGWADNTPVGVSKLTFKTIETKYAPMVPTIDSSATWSNENFKTTTPFFSANLSFGQLENMTNPTPYLGTNPDENGNVFYIVNYSLKATDITFTCTVNGENADRLRVAVFQENGICVFTNATFYYGKKVDAQLAKHELLVDVPADWTSYSTSYFTRSGEDPDYTYTAVKLVAPAYRANTYYDDQGGLLTSRPANWDTAWTSYSSVASPFTAVKGVAPTFVADTYYQFVAAQPEKLSAPGTVNQINVATRIAASADGAAGKSQGFVVKAWFDGPTQVDAYGGQNATFALVASAAVVAG